MTKIARIALLVSALLAVGLSGLRAQDASSLRFDYETWDFGKIKEVDGPVSHTFRFVNEAGNPIVIERVSTSCGCTTPEYSRRPVASGGSGEITITFDPDYRPGYFSKDVYISSDGGRSRNVLTVTGEVIPRPRPVEETYPFVAGAGGLRFDKLYLDMGAVEQGEPLSMTIGWANTSPRDIRFGFDLAPADNMVTVNAPETLCTGCKGEMTVTARIPEGGFYGSFSYRLVPRAEGAPLPLSVTVRGIAVDNFSAATPAPVSILPETYHYFGKVKSAGSYTHTFRLVNDGQGALVVRCVEPEKGVSCSLRAGSVVGAGNACSFNVTLDTTGEEYDVVSRVVRIIVNDPANPVRTLRVTAEVGGE